MVLWGHHPYRGPLASIVTRMCIACLLIALILLAAGCGEGEPVDSTTAQTPSESPGPPASSGACEEVPPETAAIFADQAGATDLVQVPSNDSFEGPLLSGEDVVFVSLATTRMSWQPGPSRKHGLAAANS